MKAITHRPPRHYLALLLFVAGHAAAAEAAPAANVGGLLQVVMSLLLVLAVMVAVAWVLKSFGPRRLMGQVPVRVVGGVHLGGRERVLVVEIGEQWIVVGATPGRVSALATLSKQELNLTPEQPEAKNFSAWLKQTLRRDAESRTDAQ